MRAEIRAGRGDATPSTRFAAMLTGLPRSKASCAQDHAQLRAAFGAGIAVLRRVVLGIPLVRLRRKVELHHGLSPSGPGMATRHCARNCAGRPWGGSEMF